MTTLIIPRPPSANKLFVNVPGKGRVKSAAYRTWQTQVGWYVKLQKPEPVTGPYEVEIEVPIRSPLDLDNHVKAVVDLLVFTQVTPDDKHMRKLTVERCAGDNDLIVTVRAAA